MEMFIVLLSVFLVFCGLVLYLIAPRLKGPSTKEFLGWDYAHRGFHDREQGVPENSYRAFELAVQKGYGMELDIQPTADDQLVVFHDFDLKRMCGVEGLVKEMTYAELQAYQLLDTEEKIPLLSQILDLVAGQVPLIIEIKSEDRDASRVCQLLLQLLENYDGLYCIESFNPMVLVYLKKHRPDLVRGQLSGPFKKKKGLLYWLLRNLWTNVLTRPDFIAYQSAAAPGNVFLKLIKLVYAPLMVVYTTKSKAEYQANTKFFDCQIFEGFEP